MLRTARLLPLKGFRHWASPPTVSPRQRQSATGPPDSYPDRTHTGKQRRARPAINRLHDQPPVSGRTAEKTNVVLCLHGEQRACNQLRQLADLFGVDERRTPPKKLRDRRLGELLAQRHVDDAQLVGDHRGPAQLEQLRDRRLGELLAQRHLMTRSWSG